MKALGYIGLILVLASFVFLHLTLKKIVKNEQQIVLLKDELFKLVGAIGAASLFSLLAMLGLILGKGWTLTGGQYAMSLIGSFFFGLGLSTMYATFGLNFYKPTLEKITLKFVRLFMYISIPVIIIFLALASEGIAAHLVYPLANRISLTDGFVDPFNHTARFAVTFYGILIVSGAIIVYFVADHFFFKKFKRHGILDTTFYIAFPAGLVGARLWYCYVLEFDRYANDFLAVLQVWDGGLAIMGGAILGIIVGVTFLMVRRKYINIRWAMDVIVPAILIAQAIGRWGNFFNIEVHGNQVLASAWSFLPSILTNNLAYSSTSGHAAAGYIYLPLFLIESVTNILGYFVITYGVGKGLRKWISLGDLSMGYLIWYGATRAIMEPLRDGNFEYGESWISSFLLIGVGVIGIIVFHVYDYIRKKKNLEPRNYETV
ncbi:MAG: prolipoprotein diacylglyceryl transferase [Erysipelotrichia bacterium]|jgi:phosphatidylglycerol:prolipoprotein diacylglycerol transferase|nr:prolipoprotein diacylglyceryl transferase [Erysipelotrichia bacterium]